MADTDAFCETQSLGIHEALKELLGLMGRLEAWQAIWMLLENLSQPSKEWIGARILF